MSSNHLILFTASFPFGKGEPFLEIEILYLAKAFEKVTIVSQAVFNTNRRDVPKNVEVRNMPIHLSKSERIFSLSKRFSKIFKEENRYIRETDGLTMNTAVFKTIVVSLGRARKFEKIARDLNSEFAEYSNYFYSYWSDDCAIGLAIFRSNNPQTRCFSRVHGWDVYFEASEIGYLPMRKYLSQYLDTIFTISEAGKNYCIDRWNVSDPHKLKLSRLGVEAQSFHENYKDPFTIVSCANMIPLKRIHLLIDALGMLETKKQIRWVHFGDGPLAEELKQRADDNIPKEIDVRFVGHLSNSELMKWYAENQPALFVNTSTTEGIPVSIMEAMSFGTPVLATNVGGTSEIVNETNGVLVDTDISSSELALEIQKWIDCEENEIKAFRNSALQTWEFDYSAEKNYTEFVKQLKAL